MRNIKFISAIDADNDYYDESVLFDSVEALQKHLEAIELKTGRDYLSHGYYQAPSENYSSKRNLFDSDYLAERLIEDMSCHIYDNHFPGCDDDFDSHVIEHKLKDKLSAAIKKVLEDLPEFSLIQYDLGKLQHFGVSHD